MFFSFILFKAIITISVRLATSKAIKKDDIEGEIVEPPFQNENEEDNKRTPVESNETSPKKSKKPDDNPEEGLEKITEEMLRKHCHDSWAAMDLIFCDNFLPANMRNRDRVKGR